MRIVVAVGGNALIRAGQDGHVGGAARATRARSPRPCVALRARGPRGRAHPRQRPAGRRAAAAARARRGRGRAAAARRADRDDPGPDRLPARERVRARSTRRSRPPCCSRACWSTARRPGVPRRRPSRSARSTTPTRRSAARATRGWDVAPDAGRGWRRVVPSPHPREVLGERARRRRCSSSGAVVIAGGGGGIPVAADGSEVVGRRRASSTRTAAPPSSARDIGADVLVLLTGVPRVALDFGTRWERELARLTVSDALRGLRRRATSRPAAWARRSSRPGASSRSRGGRAVVTSADRLVAAVAGDDGTWIVPDARAPRCGRQRGPA